MPCEPLDAPDDLRKQALSQLAFGHLQDEVPGMSDEASAGLEEPLLQARERPALDGERQDEPAQEIPPSPAGVPTNLPSGKVRHDIRDEKFTGLYVVPLIAIDQQLDAGVLVLPDQVDGLGHGAEKAAQRSASSQPLALRRHCGIVAGK